jgi:hypothetical protein
MYIERLYHILEDLKDRLGSLAGGSLPPALQAKILASAITYVFSEFLDSMS